MKGNLEEPHIEAVRMDLALQNPTDSQPSVGATASEAC